MAKQLTKPSKTFHDLRRGTPDEVGALKIEVSCICGKNVEERILIPRSSILIPFPPPIPLCSGSGARMPWTSKVGQVR